MSKTNKLRAPTVTLALLTLCPIYPANAQSDITPEQAHKIGVEAYTYLYPLLSMDLSRKQFTNVEPDKEVGKGPMNTFVNMKEYPQADFRSVVRPNFDTLYSSAWLDLTRGALVISAPDTDGRYYLLPMIDMWTDVFASPGWRTTGTEARNFLVTPPGWSGTIPEGLTHIPAPTPYVWIIGRTKTDGEADYPVVHKVQSGYSITPLSQWGKTFEPATVKIDPTVDMKTPPKVQVDSMPAAQYFSYAAELLKLNPPHSTDQPIIAQMKKIGLTPGTSFDFNKLDPALKQALETVPTEAQELMKWKLPTIARVTNGWSMNTDTMGVYGNYYLKRAIIAQAGLGANLPEDAIYPLNLTDSDGKPLDGSNKYVIHFTKADSPPVDAFWSVTLYDSEGFQVGNSLNRFALSSWMPFKTNEDGSLDLYFQHESPGKDKEANWLPAPKGAFNITMRLYAPKPEALNGKWNPPVIKRM